MKTHGMSETRPWNAWNNMRARCKNPNYSQFKSYGGRGITFSEKWETFEGFWEDMKDGYDDKLTLDRVDVNGNYSKENCRWVDMKTQQNNKTNNRMVTFNGETLNLSQWASVLGLDVRTLWRRIESGWSYEKIITTQVRKYAKRH